MKTLCRAAVAQWTKRLTRNGQTRVQISKGAYFIYYKINARKAKFYLPVILLLNYFVYYFWLQNQLQQNIERMFQKYFQLLMQSVPKNMIENSVLNVRTCM